jgi:bifunctional non-homologous end joining protein LigD
MTPAEHLAKELGAPQRAVHGGRLLPMMCERETSKAALSRGGWLYELKLDGVRIVADKKNERVSLSYRRLRDATDSYPEIAKALKSLADAQVVLDGEIVAFDAQGRPDFQLLAQRFTAGPRRNSKVAVVYVVFDCLSIGPYDLRGFPLEARKEILKRVVPEEGLANGLVRLHPTFEQGEPLFQFCEQHELEGVVAKKLGSIYRVGERTNEWLKIKREHDGEFIVVGWTERQGVLRALDLAAFTDAAVDRLAYRGKVGSGLNGATLEALLPVLRAIEHPEPTSVGVYSPPDAGVVRHHCRAELVVSVRYLMISREGNLRNPVYRGLRPDTDPKDCVVADPRS